MNQRKVLFIGLVWPEPTSSAAGKRILQLVELFQNQGFEVIFSSAASRSDSSFDLSQWNVEEIKIELNHDSFNEFVRKINPDFVVYDRYVSEEQFGWRVVQECPRAIQILDTEDLHFLRSAREKAYKKKEEIQLYNDIAQREIASILRCDLSLIISEFELNLLKNEFRILQELLHYLPFLENPEELNNQKLKSFDERKDFVFIGNFLHEPNWQTVLHLKKVIWPKIKSNIPEARLNIYGAYATQKVHDLNNSKDGFIVHGKAENAQNVISEARILLAPILFGAGQKGKFIDALHTGTPIATNSMGAESMFEKLTPGIVEDNESEFVTKVIELYRNKDVWNDAQQNCHQILKERFNKNFFKQIFIEKLMSLESDLSELRKRNFIGQILKQNLVNSIKYMSLWIETKNK